MYHILVDPTLANACLMNFKELLFQNMCHIFSNASSSQCMFDKKSYTGG